MLKRFTFWTPLFILLSITHDAIARYDDPDYLWMCCLAGIGWLFFWDALNDLVKEKNEETNNV